MNSSEQAASRARFWIEKAENRLDNEGGSEIGWVDAQRYIAMGNAWANIGIAEAVVENEKHGADEDDIAPYIEERITEEVH